MAPAFAPGAEFAAKLDAADELASFRRAFELPRERRRPLVYLCGHSLGLMPRRAPSAVAAELERWAAHGAEAHFHGKNSWLDYHERFAAPLAALVGARRDEVVAMNSLTVNLHLMLVSFFRPAGKRTKILIERGAFPSDRYAVQSQLAHHGLDPATHLLEIGARRPASLLDLDEYEALLAARGEEIALVLLPGVQFLTGQALPIAELAAAARRYGCRAGFDLAHAIGNVPLALHAAGADFAVWCSYKYLNAGPGAVGGCFVHRKWLDRADVQRFAGWWGHDKATRFAARAAHVPLAGADAWQLSNPPILAMVPLAASLDIFRRAPLRALRRKSVRLTGYLEALLEHELADRVDLVTPRDPDARGCQLSLRVAVEPARLGEVRRRLRAAGVVADWRGTDILRMAPAPLYNRYRDVFAAVHALRGALAR